MPWQQIWREPGLASRESAVPQEKMAGMMMGSSGFFMMVFYGLYIYGENRMGYFFGIFGGYWDTIEKLIGGLEHDFEFSILLGMS